MTAKGYSARDYVHFLHLLARNRRRQKRWGRKFEACIRDGSFRVPSAAVVQLIPTEACNLRCPMCNQWGENGYFWSGVRPVSAMDKSALEVFLEDLSPRDSLVSLHGGEPFAYRHIGLLLSLLARGEFDTIITTNGTLFEKWIDPLSEIRNLALLLSIDGDEKTHDAIRGRGSFAKARDAVHGLAEARARKHLPRALLVMSHTVCEWNADAVGGVFAVASSLGAFAVNYNMRWFLPEGAGLAYEKHLKKEFGLTSSGAWRGWISNHPDVSYRRGTEILAREVGKRSFRLRPPFVMTTPGGLRGPDFARYFEDFSEVFGNESCFMPFYWARIHSNGDLIFCPGHPDIIAGNVFRDGFDASFNSEVARHFRRHILENRFPICNRCCGLYMTSPARSQEQRARRRLGLKKSVNALY
jgi:MoaA/NifB/PqqE/SkfB family radical SAM enzyme